MTTNFQDILINVGTKLNSNKYLASIRDSFVELMPFTIIGSLAVLWSNVLVNESTGLGAVFKPIMALSFLNPAFNALNFCTLGCISLIIAFLIGTNLANSHEKLDKIFSGALGVASFIAITNTTTTIGGESVSGIFSSSLGSNGLFSAMIAAMVGVELFAKLYKVEALKIKLPDQVPPQIGRSFEYLIPACIDLMILCFISLFVQFVTGGLYISDLIQTCIQTPLMNVGGSLPGILLLAGIMLLLWCVGLHGDNILSGVITPIMTSMSLANMQAVANGETPTYVFTTSFKVAFICSGGIGMCLALSLAVLIRAKREDTRAIAKMALPCNLFNICEIDVFGLPVVLNTNLMIPYVLGPLVSVIIGYVAIKTGFCPAFTYEVPWTMPPLLASFVATGGSIFGVITQLIAIAACVLIYLPFVAIDEKAKNLADQKTKEESTEAQ